MSLPVGRRACVQCFAGANSFVSLEKDVVVVEKSLEVFVLWCVACARRQVPQVLIFLNEFQVVGDQVAVGRDTCRGTSFGLFVFSLCVAQS